MHSTAMTCKNLQDANYLRKRITHKLSQTHFKIEDTAFLNTQDSLTLKSINILIDLINLAATLEKINSPQLSDMFKRQVPLLLNWLTKENGNTKNIRMICFTLQNLLRDEYFFVAIEEPNKIKLFFDVIASQCLEMAAKASIPGAPIPSTPAQMAAAAVRAPAPEEAPPPRAPQRRR